MTKIIKKVTLNAPASISTGVDPTKGTVTNPFTQVEMATLQEEGKWNGGITTINIINMKYIVNMLLIMTSSVFLACSSNTITKAQIDNVCTQTTAIEKGVRLTNLMCSGNYDKALVLLDTLLEIDPYAPNYYFCQGWCYDMLGDSLKAKKSYLQAKELYNKYNVLYDASSVAFSKAYVTLCLEGEDAFFCTLDSLCDDLSKHIDYIRKMKSEWENSGISKKDLFTKDNHTYFIPNKE